MKLSKEQIDYFETFGFLKFPGMLKDDIGWIVEEFEKVFPMFEESSNHDGSKRTSIVPFIDQREKLSALMDHPQILSIATSLLGEDFNYMGSDGNYYSGDTTWHPDGDNRLRKHIKIAFYLQPLNGSTGALRVIPGSHRLDDQFGQDIKMKVGNSMGVWGVPGNEVPAVALDVIPGDILVFDHNTFHSSWGGGRDRKMFTMNLCQRFSAETIDELRNYILIHGHYHREHYYGPEMLRNGGAQRLVHLEQVISVSGDYLERTKNFAKLTRKA